MKSKLLLLLLCVVVFSSGCATKRYGRMQPVTGLEMTKYTCDEIQLELSKIEAFELQVAKGAEFSVLSVASFLGDFGIGNVIEKDAALKTARERKIELRKLEATKGCK